MGRIRVTWTLADIHVRSCQMAVEHGEKREYRSGLELVFAWHEGSSAIFLRKPGLNRKNVRFGIPMGVSPETLASMFEQLVAQTMEHLEPEETVETVR